MKKNFKKQTKAERLGIFKTEDFTLTLWRGRNKYFALLENDMLNVSMKKTYLDYEIARESFKDVVSTMMDMQNETPHNDSYMEKIVSYFMWRGTLIISEEDVEVEFN